MSSEQDVEKLSSPTPFGWTSSPMLFEKASSPMLFGWTNFGIPFRDTGATYSSWQYETLPPVHPDNHRWSHMKTLDDIAEALDAEEKFVKQFKKDNTKLKKKIRKKHENRVRENMLANLSFKITKKEAKEFSKRKLTKEVRKNIKWNAKCEFNNLVRKKSKNLGLLPRNSPTSCYYWAEGEDGDDSFYCDQQDCVVWHLDEDGVFIYKSDDSHPRVKVYVSISLAEFLYRIDIENEIWNDCSTYGNQDEMVFVNAESVELWPKNDLSPEAKAYLNHYVELWKSTRKYLLAGNYGCTEKNINEYLKWFFKPNSLEHLEQNTSFPPEQLKFLDQLEETGNLDVTFCGFFTEFPELTVECQQKFDKLVESATRDEKLQRLKKGVMTV